MKNAKGKSYISRNVHFEPRGELLVLFISFTSLVKYSGTFICKEIGEE